MAESTPVLETDASRRGLLYPHAMDSYLADACAALQVDATALGRASDASDADIATAIEFLESRLGTTGGELLDVVACGSLARRERTPDSDLDYLIIAHGLVDDPMLHRKFRKACIALSREHFKKPGSSGVFGRIVSAAELVESIGLEADTNASLTRRVLLLEEGRSLLRPNLHRKFVTTTLDRYLNAGFTPGAVAPRFLINDVARYWRTLTIDYQAKRWEAGTDSGWGLRYLKLRISRKLTYAGTLVSIFLSRDACSTPQAQREFLVPQLVDVSPLGRLSQLISYIDDDPAIEQPLRRILSAANDFTAFLQSDSGRTSAKDVEPERLEHASTEFREIRDKSLLLHEDLKDLFFESATLRSQARHYLAF